MSGLKPGINAICFDGHFIKKLPVPIYIRPAWCADLHKREAMQVSRIQLQETLDTPKA